jgi:acyl-CoA synthetase (AMP-forming)/AMP-acid ligase II
MAEVVRDWPLRAVPAHLRSRYLGEGHWTDETLGPFLRGCLEAHGALPFRIWSSERPVQSTIGAVHEQALRLAGGLRAAGIGAGDVLAFQLPNWAEAAATLLAASMLGVVIVPIVHYYGAREVGFALGESRARAFLTTDRFRRIDYVSLLDAIRPSLPDLELVVMLSSAGGALPAGVVPYHRVAAADPLDRLPAVDPDQPAVIAYTSGTTADPKGVIHTHRSFLAEIRQLAAIQIPGGRPMLVGAPIGHAIGMLGGLLMPLYRGHAVHLTDVWDAGAVLDAMSEADLTAGSGATVFLLSLLDHPRFSAAHAAKMSWIGLGGAPVPTAVAERAEAMGIQVARAYGSSEHPSTTGSSPSDARAKRNATDGRPLSGVELRIVDDDGRDLPVGAAGEIWSRGPDLCAGYTDPALTRAAFHDGGWYASGDVGVLDADGYLTITDRKKDIIIRGGANISAAEIEELVMRMPAVAEVAVVGAPDPRLGERPFAFLRLRPGAPAPDLAAMQRHLEGCGLAKPKWPEQLRVVDDFPRTASGKIKKYTLREALRAQAQGGE